MVLLFGAHSARVGADLLAPPRSPAVHELNGAIDWPVTPRLATGSTPWRGADLLNLSRLGLDAKGTSAAITTTLGAALIVTAVALTFRRQFLAAVTPFFVQLA